MSSKQILNDANQKPVVDTTPHIDKENASLPINQPKQALKTRQILQDIPTKNKKAKTHRTRKRKRKRKRDRDTFNKENEESDIPQSAPRKKRRKLNSRCKAKRNKNKKKVIVAETTSTTGIASGQQKKKSKTIRMAKTNKISEEKQENQEERPNKKKNRRHSLYTTAVDHKAHKKKVTMKLGRYFRTTRKTEIKMDDFVEMIINDKEIVNIDNDQIIQIIHKLHDQNRVFINKGVLHRL